MEVLIIIIAVVSFAIYKMWHNARVTKQNKELIQSVTSLSRGTVSEQHLILTLLKSDNLYSSKKGVNNFIKYEDIISLLCTNP